MDNFQIDAILKKHYATRKIYLGSFPCDHIPFSDNFPYCLIANTDKMGKPGVHWIAIYVPKRNFIEYFDSYSFEPNEDVKNYLKTFDNVEKNSTSLQDFFSTACGPFCIYFIINRAMGKELKEIIKKLSKIIKNDKFVENFVLKLQNEF